MKNCKNNLISFAFITAGAIISATALATNCTNFNVIANMCDNNCGEEAAGSCYVNYIANDQYIAPTTTGPQNKKLVTQDLFCNVTWKEDDGEGNCVFPPASPCTIDSSGWKYTGLCPGGAPE